LGAAPDTHVDLDLAVDLNDEITHMGEQNEHVFGLGSEVHDGVQVHLQNGIRTQALSAPASPFF
jgi:hypothetical protein